MQQRSTILGAWSVLALSVVGTTHAAPILQLQAADYNAATGTWTADFGPNATQGTVGNRPTLIPNATPTGASAVRFDGGDWLALASGVGNTGGGDIYTAFAVVRPDDTATSKTIFSGDFGSFQYFINSTERQHVNKNNVFSLGAGNSALSTTDYSVISVTYSQAVSDSAFYLNGAADGGPTLGSGVQRDISGQVTRIGIKQQLNEAYDGDIVEIRIYNTLLSSSERAQIEAELTAAYIPEPTSLGVLALGGLIALRRQRA